MLNRRQFVSTALTAATLPYIARGQFCSVATGTTIVQPTLAQIERIIQLRLPTVSPNIGAAIGFASPDFGAQIVCLGSVVDQLGNPMPFTTDTPFEIASITKPFIGAIYELMLQRGQVKGGDTLGTYLSSSLASAIRSVPLFDLANFTSGFPADNNGLNNTAPASVVGGYTNDDLNAFLAAPPFKINPPGVAYTYSNLGFSLLALALQAASGISDFYSFARTEILGPAGMVKTRPYTDTIGAQLPRGFDSQGNPTGPGWGYFPAYFGAGGLVSTPNDLMTWLQLSMGIIQQPGLGSALPVTQTPQAVGLSGLGSTFIPGLGWFVSEVQDSAGLKLEIVQKNGDLDGFSSQMAFLRPSGGCSSSSGGVFVLVNGGNRTATENSAATNIAYDLLFSMVSEAEPRRL